MLFILYYQNELRESKENTVNKNDYNDLLEKYKELEKIDGETVKKEEYNKILKMYNELLQENTNTEEFEKLKESFIELEEKFNEINYQKKELEKRVKNLERDNNDYKVNKMPSKSPLTTQSPRIDSSNSSEDIEILNKKINELKHENRSLMNEVEVAKIQIKKLNDISQKNAPNSGSMNNGSSGIWGLLGY